jgi:hypothetical protein
MAGLRAAWTMRVGQVEHLVSASSVDCFERVITTARLRRGERVVSHAGDGGLLAYAVARAGGGLLGRLNDRMRGETVATRGIVPVAVAADNNQLAVLDHGGEVQLLSSTGEVIRTLDVGPARAIALRAHRLIVLTDTATIDVFDSKSGVRIASWPVPSGVTPRLDVHFGVAVITHGSLLYAISIESGKRVLIARAASAIRAQIEAPGVAYAYNRAGKGVVKYVPFSKIERLLRTAKR